MTKEESDEVKRNDLIVAKEGRQKNLNLYRNKMRIPLHDWLSQILDEMMVIAETVNSGHSAYIDVIKTAKDRLKFPENTISAMLLESIISDSQSFEEFGFIKGNEHKKDFAKYKNHSILEIEEEVELSIKKKALIENQDEESFDEFLKNYLKIC